MAVKVTWHDAAFVEPVTALSVHDVGEKEVVPSEDLNVSTVPAGIPKAVVPVTVAVQVVDPPIVKDAGEQDTAVVVGGNGTISLGGEFGK